MTFIKRALATTAALACLTGAAAAQDFTLYGESGGWKVFVDTEQKTCLIEKTDMLENVVQMGLTEDRIGYVGVFTKADIDAKRDERIPVIVMIGDNMYAGDATAMRGNITEGYSGGYVLSDDPQFVTDLAQQYEMFVFPAQGDAFVVSLEGTLNAIATARECNAAQMQ